MKMTVNELENLELEDVLTTQEGIQVSVVEQGDWINDGKYQNMEIIFTDGDRFYSGSISRSGSYFTDYTYESEWCGEDPAEINEVRKVTKTIEVWEAV